jgi:CRISPR/Cas system-associated exonuclease Cas4 (RecB family)
VDYTVETTAGELRIKGETDPVIVNRDGDPLLPTEVKTKTTVEDVESPNPHHLAQLHAYLRGLDRKYDHEVSEGVIIYGARKTLDVKAFPVSFDRTFWDESVLEWASQHTQYRLDEGLPPASPEQGWECQFCSYRERCGRGDSQYEDIGPRGFLPQYADYPRKQVVEYLEAHDSAKLTPALANMYPDLRDEYGVYKWQCVVCSGSYEHSDIDWAGPPEDPPLCPTCTEDGVPADLTVPGLAEQPSATSTVTTEQDNG